MKIVRFCWILVAGLWGCLSGPDCFDTSTSKVTMGFYNTSGTLVTVAVDSIAISGLNAYLIPETGLQTFQLPLNPQATEVLITFYMGTQMHTLALTYQVETQVVSKDCGALAYLNDLQLTTTTFAQVTISNPRLTTNGGINVKIRME
ncbi:MAG: hypothetical protein KF775_08170 [Cyclobacteriaceae bacterium]|nr:hypothetical protein [Cyclobacteriaceae bacterium]